tara:strand:- start:1719 stop:1970 length:252 start_codon:yes stop_codon:yes gene_type:complete
MKKMLVTVQSEFLKTTLKATVHVMATVDHSSAVLLTANEEIVDFSIDHGVPMLAYGSLFLVQFFDHFGTAIIAFSLWLASLLN